MFIVLGQARSGTTLVAQCLSAHPDLIVPPETDLVVPLALLCQRVPDPEVGLAIAADLVVNTRRFDETLGRHLTADRARRAVLESPWTLSSVLGGLYAAVAESAGAVRAGDKSPNDFQYARALANAGAFDGAIPVIHVVRDVRDLIGSYDELGWVPGFHPNTPRYWEVNNLYVADAVPANGAPYLLVRYEDLVADPRAVCTTLGDFLGVGFDPAMLDDATRYAQFPGYEDIGQHQRTFEPITTDAVGRYRGRLDKSTLREVDRLAGDAMDRFGYTQHRRRRRR